jgi:hypothetical protein
MERKNALVKSKSPDSAPITREASQCNVVPCCEGLPGMLSKRLPIMATATLLGIGFFFVIMMYVTFVCRVHSLLRRKSRAGIR